MHQDRAGHEVTTNHNMREFFSKMWWVFFLSSSASDCSMDIMADIHDGCLIESMAPVCTADNHRGFLMMTAISTNDHCSRWTKISHSEIQIKRKKTVLDWSQDSSAVAASSRPAKAPFFFLPGRREIVVWHCQCQDWASPTIMYIYILSFIIEDKQWELKLPTASSHQPSILLSQNWLLATFWISFGYLLSSWDNDGCSRESHITCCILLQTSTLPINLCSNNKNVRTIKPYKHIVVHKHSGPLPSRDKPQLCFVQQAQILQAQSTHTWVVCTCHIKAW